MDKRKLQQPTLLMFTLGAAAEQRRRRWLPEALAPEERSLRQRCLERALEAGRDCGFRLEVSCPESLSLPTGAQRVEQKGIDFAERLSLAFDGAVQRNPGPVLAVGSDIPGLSSQHLQQALDMLEKNPGQVVVGPSPDGGLYLLAACVPLGSVISRTRWCRHDTLTSLLRQLRHEGWTVSFLQPLTDLDSSSDLERWVHGHSSPLEGWRRWIRSLRIAFALWRRPDLHFNQGQPQWPAVVFSPGRSPPSVKPAFLH